jgi:hypothetical protein
MKWPLIVVIDVMPRYTGSVIMVSLGKEVLKIEPVTRAVVRAHAIQRDATRLIEQSLAAYARFQWHEIDEARRTVKASVDILPVLPIRIPNLLAFLHLNKHQYAYR